VMSWVRILALVQSSRGGRSAAIFSSNQALCVYGIARNTASWLWIFQLVVVFEKFAPEPIVRPSGGLWHFYGSGFGGSYANRSPEV
jgi:hypothetical protein